MAKFRKGDDPHRNTKGPPTLEERTVSTSNGGTMSMATFKRISLQEAETNLHVIGEIRDNLENDAKVRLQAANKLAEYSTTVATLMILVITLW